LERELIGEEPYAEKRKSGKLKLAVRGQPSMSSVDYATIAAT
jgi:hypothetical protein